MALVAASVLAATTVAHAQSGRPDSASPSRAPSVSPAPSQVAPAATPWQAPAASSTAPSTSEPLPQYDYFDVSEAYAAMNRSNPVLMALLEGNQAAESDVIAAGLWTNPMAVVNYTHSLNGPSYTYDSIGNGQLVIQQLLELSNLPGARHDVAQAMLEATRNDSEGVRRSLFFDLRAAIISMTTAVQRRIILHETADHLMHARNIVAIRVDAGAAPRYDLARINIALAAVRADEFDAVADLAAARGMLDVTVGAATRSLHGVPRFDLFESPPLPAVASLVDAAERLRPDLRAAVARMRAARSSVDVARRSVFQGISAYAGAAFGAGNPGSPGQPGYHGTEVDIVLGMAIPLPVLDRGQGTIPAAERRAYAADYVSRAMLVQARLRIEALYRELQLRRENLASYDETTPAEADEMLRMAEAQYREGRTQILELVDAYTSVRDARLRRLGLANDARVAELELARAVGQVMGGDEAGRSQ